MTRLDKFREFLKRESLGAFIVPSNDPHFGEYIQNRFKCREWLSGFDGSAGTLVISLDDAALWTDSRYFIQAEKVLRGSGIVLKKLKVEGTESIAEWLSTRLSKGLSVGIDSSLYSVSEYFALKSSLPDIEIRLCEDPFDKIWDNREQIVNNEIFYLDEKYSGKSVVEKHLEMISSLRLEGDFLYIVSACDDIAWLCNIRGSDIEYNPLALAFAAVTRSEIYLFICKKQLSEETYQRLVKQGVIIEEYSEFRSFISGYSASVQRVANPDAISIGNYIAATGSGAPFINDDSRGGVIANLKAVKNDVEIAGFRKAMINDAVAWVKMLYFIKSNLSGGTISLHEKMVADKLAEFRAESPDYRGESFSPIVAYNSNAAAPHYEPTDETSSEIIDSGFLLIDTGAHYCYGTTDTTRTLCFGGLTDEQKRDYTLILKGMIALSMAKFREGTRGSQLDILARGPISSIGKIYMHGTGHGIGHYLCVHEGPQSIRMEENPVTIKPGMVISNEPAVYEDGRYGIRIENTILCRMCEETKFGRFYDFETLNYIPIETDCLQLDLLSDKELQWLVSYNQEVYKKVSPLLNEEEAKWLYDYLLKPMTTFTE